MSGKNLTLGLIALAITAPFIYRDAVALDCPGVAHGCIAAKDVPCSAVSPEGGCVPVVTGKGSPGGKCDDGSGTKSWAATAPPDFWQDCITRKGQGACPRLSAVCQTISNYKGLKACRDKSPCGTKKIEACTHGSPAATCSIAVGG